MSCSNRVIVSNIATNTYRNGVAAFGIYKKASIQSNQLSHFYEWCKFMGLCGPYESPIIDQIPEIQVQALETFLNGMWQLTDIESSSSSSPSSSSSSITTTTESPQTSLLDSSSSTSTEDDNEKQERRLEIVVSNQWVKFEENPLPNKPEMGPLIQLDQMGDQEMGPPLIQLDDDDEDEAIININDSWEAILEASIGSQSLTHSTNNSFFNLNIGYGYGWEMQAYNPHALNPFHQPHNVYLYSGK